MKEAETILHSVESALFRENDIVPPGPKVGHFQHYYFQLTHNRQRNWRLKAAFDAIKEAQEYLSKIPIGVGRPLGGTIGKLATCALDVK